MFASLDRIDAEMDRQNGQRRFVQTDHRDAQEIEAARELSILFALSRVLGPRHVESTEAQVIYYIPSRPPEFLIEAVASAGGRVFVGESPRSWSDVTDSLRAPPRPVDDLLNEAMTALARRTAAEKRLPLDWEGLERFEDELLAIWGHGDDEIDVDIDEDEDEDDDEDNEDEDGGEKRDADGGEARWTRYLQLSSFTGELLRRDAGGRWIVNTDSGDLVPLFFRCSKGDTSLVINIVGKAAKMKANGKEDSVRFLGRSAIAMLQG